MQLNLTISSLSGTLYAINETSVSGSGTYSITPVDTLMGQPLRFQISGCTITGNTISFTDAYGRNWSQQIIQTSGLIRNSVCAVGGTLEPIFGSVIREAVSDSQAGVYLTLNPYINMTPELITETQSGSGILTVEFYNCELIEGNTISVSIT